MLLRRLAGRDDGRAKLRLSRLKLTSPRLECWECWSAGVLEVLEREMEIRFFDSSSEFREWLETNHQHAGELVLGFYKKGSGKRGISYAESVDEALCFGWIDGVQKNLGAISYSIRFTPRKKNSIWSLANLRRVERLKKSGRMKRAGLESHSMRDPAKTGIYSFENATRTLAVDEERKFRLEKTAWDFFQNQTPSYRRMAIWWIVSAKKDETRARRLSLLIEDSARERTLAQFTRSKSS
jgi:uncharacterized protein YdeI (YjbR/CyaY-like superfamily)